MKGYTVAELDRFYSEGESMDKRHFAEQRSFILLYFGNHYKAKVKDFLDRTLDKTSEQTRLRLQENHIQRVIGRYEAGILNQALDVTVGPYNENELQDQKDAELSLGVMQADKEILNWEEKKAQIIKNYLVTGEVFTLEYWNPNLGKQIGWEQEMTPEGDPLFEDALTKEPTTQAMHVMGMQNQPLQSERPVMEGALVLDVINAFNVKRDKSAQTISESPFLCIDKLVSEKEAKAMAAGDEEKLKAITKNGKNAFKVFESSSGDYVDSGDQVLLKYWFFRPCYDYPNGLFQVQCNSEVFSEGELPFGVWPINYLGFRSAPGTPRATSLIKDIRHPQIELNRLVSQQAYTTLALGDDKVFTTMGSKLQKGATWSGIRHFEVNGQAPTILQGRDGMQFEASINRAIKTIYDLADIEYMTQSSGQQDAEAQLYSKMSQKLKFSPHAKAIENLFKKIWTTHLTLAKKYYSDDRIVKAVGRREAVNIAEFKSTGDDSCEIKIVPMNDDIDSMMGKSMQIRQIMQYVGKSLDQQTIARMVRNMPFLNKDNIFNKYLITEENIESDLLALDRGEPRPAMKSDKHKEYIEAINNRMKQADYRLLDPQIQALYDQKLQQHEKMAADEIQELKRLEAGFIPTSGPLVKVDFYQDGKRMVMHADSLQWLVDAVAKQGVTQDQLGQLDQHNQIEILKQAQQLANQGNGPTAGVQSQQPMPSYQ